MGVELKSVTAVYGFKSQSFPINKT